MSKNNKHSVTPPHPYNPKQHWTTWHSSNDNEEINVNTVDCTKLQLWPGATSKILWRPSTDVSHLTKEQTNSIWAIEAFACDKGDIGNILSIQMTISLKVDLPLQRTYALTHLQRVQKYIQDLLLKSWILKSLCSTVSTLSVSGKEMVPSACA